MAGLNFAEKPFREKKFCSVSAGYLFLASPKHINQSRAWPRAGNRNIFQAPHFDTLIEVQIVLKKINCLLSVGIVLTKAVQAITKP